MKIIDFHQHLGMGVDDQAIVLKKLHIKKAIMMPYDFGDLSEKEAYVASQQTTKNQSYINGFLKELHNINQGLLDNIRDQPRMVFTPWLSPECDNLESFIEQPQTKVVKFVPIFDNLTSDYFTVKVIPYVKLAVNNGKKVMFHTGWGAPVKPLENLAALFPQGDFIIGHMKEDFDYYAIDRARLLSTYDNVYCETSYSPHAKRIYQLVKNGLGDRLLFGSDLRKQEDIQSLKGNKQMIKKADIYRKEKRSILYHNAAKLLQ